VLPATPRGPTPPPPATDPPPPPPPPPPASPSRRPRPRRGARRPTGTNTGPAGSSTCAHQQKNSTTTPARSPNRASQPRTVERANPSPPAIRRDPSPAAAATSAEPITSTPSCRRPNATSANNTCVTPQPPHRARRGRSHTSTPAPNRSFRIRAKPHRANRSPHPGHANRPAANAVSTPTGSFSTVSTDASGIVRKGPLAPAKRITRGSLRVQDLPTLSPPPPSRQPARHPRHAQAQCRERTAP